MDNNIKIPPLAERPRPSVTAASVLVLIAAAGLWASSFLTYAIDSQAGVRQALISALIYYLPFVVLPVSVYCCRRRGLSDALRLNPLPVLPTLTVVFLALMCVYAASAIDALWTLLLGLMGLHEPAVALDVGTSEALTAQVIVTAAIPAVCEELLFRGVVFSAFEKRGTWRGIWVSSALFMLMHGNLYGLPAYLLVGAAAAFVVYALDSLYAGMLFHTVYNTAILVLMYLMAGQDLEAAEAAALSPALLLLDGAVTGALLLTTFSTLNLHRRSAGIEPVPRNRLPLTHAERGLVLATVLALVASTAVVQLISEGAL